MILAAFQPIVDLRDRSVVGYEALARPTDGSSPTALFAAARAQGRLAEVDRECRAAALRQAQAASLAAPFALFLNADAAWACWSAAARHSRSTSASRPSARAAANKAVGDEPSVGRASAS